MTEYRFVLVESSDEYDEGTCPCTWDRDGDGETVHVELCGDHFDDLYTVGHEVVEAAAEGILKDLLDEDEFEEYYLAEYAHECALTTLKA